MKQHLIALPALLFCTTSTAALATDINVNGALDPVLTLTLQPPASVQVTGVFFTGTTQYGSVPGNASFGAMSGVMGPCDASFICPGDLVTTFSYFDADSDLLTGKLDWTSLTYDPASAVEPHLYGTITVLTSSGTPTFLADYPVQSIASVGAAFPTECSLQAFDNATCIPMEMTIAKFEGGDISPGDTPPTHVPEGSTLAFLGIALAGFFWFRRKSALDKAI